MTTTASAMSVFRADEAERTVLGAVLIDPAVFPTAGRLVADDFADPRLARAWKALLRLEAAGTPIDLEMTGRGTRIHPGKDDLLVLDVVGAWARARSLSPELVRRVKVEALRLRVFAATARHRPRAPRGRP